MSLRLVPKILDSIDVIFFLSKEFWMINSAMMKFANIKGIVGFEMVCVDYAVWFYDLFNNGL